MNFCGETNNHLQVCETQHSTSSPLALATFPFATRNLFATVQMWQFLINNLPTARGSRKIQTYA